MSRLCSERATPLGRVTDVIPVELPEGPANGTIACYSSIGNLPQYSVFLVYVMLWTKNYVLLQRTQEDGWGASSNAPCYMLPLSPLSLLHYLLQTQPPSRTIGGQRLMLLELLEWVLWLPLTSSGAWETTEAAAKGGPQPHDPEASDNTCRCTLVKPRSHNKEIPFYLSVKRTTSSKLMIARTSLVPQKKFRTSFKVTFPPNSNKVNSKYKVENLVSPHIVSSGRLN